ncbi:MAG: response regulator [Patescibacteria group bacterium]|nr:response regulator [Patescibacteria group bacterium]
MAKKKILLVEDDENLRNAMAGKLAALPLEVYQAADGEEAITMILNHRPDLVLLDLLLPKLDGFKVLERLRAYPDPAISGMRVIVLSNLWSQKDILQVQGLKVADYFVKAHTKLEQVVVRIGQVLEFDKS